MTAAHHVEQRLTTAPASVRAARQVVCEVVGDSVPREDIDDLLLATSEVVTNALEHGGPPVELAIQRADGHIRVEVRDGSPLPPRPRDVAPGPDEVRGRGMVILDRCADRWGVDELADGKAVWFERDLGPQRLPNDSTPPR